MKLLIIFSCVLVLNSIAFSQESVNENWLQEIGFWPGFGYGNSTRNLPEGNYQPYFFLGHVAFKPFLKGQNTALEKFQFYMEPQFNHVQLLGKNGIKNEFEFGLNLGVKYLFPLTKHLDLFMNIGTGLHAFSATTASQAAGFLFSDNMGMGLYHHLNNKWAVLFTYRIRHLSNADTRQPNKGINTDNFHFGLSYFIGSRQKL